ncbi:MAG: hypothetical protein ACK5MI_02615 [Mangrovibacterium sp.]
MRTKVYVLILIFSCLACQKFNSSVSEPVSLNIQIQEVGLDISEDGFNSKSLDGPGGQSVSLSDLYIYIVESGETDFSKAQCLSKPNSGSFTEVYYGKSYDIYATTLPYSNFNILDNDFSFPARDPSGELYQGKITTEALTSGENNITLPISLQTFYFDVDFAANNDAINDILGVYFISFKQNNKEYIWYYSSTNTPVYGLSSDGSIEISLYKGGYTKPEEGILVKSTLIENPETGKRYVITANENTNTSGNLDLSIVFDWDDSETAIEF